MLFRCRRALSFGNHCGLAVLESFGRYICVCASSGWVATEAPPAPGSWWRRSPAPLPQPVSARHSPQQSPSRMTIADGDIAEPAAATARRSPRCLPPHGAPKVLSVAPNQTRQLIPLPGAPAPAALPHSPLPWGMPAPRGGPAPSRSAGWPGGAGRWRSRGRHGGRCGVADLPSGR